MPNSVGIFWWHSKSALNLESKTSKTPSRCSSVTLQLPPHCAANPDYNKVAFMKNETWILWMEPVSSALPKILSWRIFSLQLTQLRCVKAKNTKKTYSSVLTYSSTFHVSTGKHHTKWFSWCHEHRRVRYWLSWQRIIKKLNDGNKGRSRATL